MALPPEKRSAGESLQILELKLKQLKHEYEQYFRGNRPRAPVMLRSEVQKLVNVFANQPLGNTALRFKFNNLCARYFAFRRQWDAVLRQIEEGTYKPHQFKADLHDQQRRSARPSPTGETPRTPGAAGLFDEYLQARRSCGEGIAGLTPERLQGLLDRQREALQERYGCREVRFRVVVEAGRTKLKASPVGRKR